MPASIADVLRAGTAALAPISDTPRLDAELLLAHAHGIPREDLLLGRAGPETPATYGALLARRAAGEPIAYITGRRAFWTIELEVGPGVLIPRPDSETLIEAGVARFGAQGPRRILDLGTGPGTLLLAALAIWPEATGLGIDLSETALAYARPNAARIASGRAVFVRADWSDAIAERFDLILCNPPYVREGEAHPSTAHEPAEALYAGPDGLAAYRALAPRLSALLAPSGVAILEIGHDQREAVSALFEGWQIESRRDLGGRDRAMILAR